MEGKIYIQIGAGAGDLDTRANCRDGFTEIVKGLSTAINRIVLVEPNPINIPLLTQCWKDYPQSFIYNIGIVPKNFGGGSSLDFYYCPLDRPHYQVASVKKEHVQKHYGVDCELQTFRVPVFQLEAFLAEAVPGGEEIELLALDIEGLDAEIVLDIDFGSLNVKYLSFEHLHLGDNQDAVLKHLQSSNFQFVGSGVDHNGFDVLYINTNKK